MIHLKTIAQQVKFTIIIYYYCLFIRLAWMDDKQNQFTDVKIYRARL